MKTAAIAILGFLAMVLPTTTNAQTEAAPAISIDTIAEDVAIGGTVRGFPPEVLQNSRIVVYVLTDQWYIHPFADGGNGKSWAYISPDGKWTIGTVKREFAAKKLAALLLPTSFRAPPTTRTLTSLPSKALVIRELTGTADEGKL
jgi:hypothetical protein